VVNLSSVANTVTVIARDNQGNALGSSTISLGPKAKTAFALRDLAGLSKIAGAMGSVDFSVSIGNLAVLGLRFNGPAFTSIQTAAQ
jgi:hypothetical protein